MRRKLLLIMSHKKFHNLEIRRVIKNQRNSAKYSSAKYQREYSKTKKSDPGHAHKYQLMVTAYLASLLSKNKSVKHYYIFYEVKELEPFGDVVLAVKYSASKDFCLYLIEVKSGKIIPEVNNYLDGYSKIMQNKKWTFLEDFCNINAENIQFWYFACEKFTKPGQITFEEDSKIKNLELKELECDPDELIIDEMYNQNYKLCLQSNNIPTKHQGFFDDFYIYLQQLNEEEIVRKLGRMWKLSNPEEVINYLEQYLIKNNNCLNKTAFEHELLRIRLSNYIITPIKAIPVTKGQAYAWINLTLPYHVTIIKNTSHIKPCLFGCILAKIEDVITVDEWNRCIDNEGKLSEDVKTKISSKKFKPRTLRDLVIHFWMSNKIPLILQADDDLPALKEFSHLNQRYIIIDSKLKKRYDEMKSYNLSVIKDLGGLQVDELLQSISVSMQGKKPTSLYELINNDNSLLETLTCSDILKLIEPKRVYLKDECFKDGSDMLFIIETEITEEYEKTIKDNILIYCPRNQGDVCYQKTVQDPRFKNYKIYRLYAHNSENGEETLSLTNEYRSKEQQLIEAQNIAENNLTEEYRGLEYFFVDQHGDNVYRENADEVVPIIGEMVNMSCPTYLPRQMHNVIIKQGKGDECTEESFSENDFFIKTTPKICVVTGVPGIGKSTFLRSLTRICNQQYYVLFYDLALYQTSLYDKSKKQSDFCRDPLTFLCNKHNSLPYNKFLSILKSDSKRLIIVLDSLDDVVATCKENVLKLIDKLNQEPWLKKIIIGSRLLSVDLLSNQYNVDLVEIDGLNVEWNGDYLQNWNINENYIQNIPAEFLENPLYLNFLRVIGPSNINMENLSRWSLYKTIIDLNIDRFYERRNENADADERSNLLKYCYALAFQALLPNNKITRKLSENIEGKYTNLSRIGVIKCFDQNDMPVFLHPTFLEFLISRWLVETSDKEGAKYIYKYMLRYDMHDILNIHSAHFRLHKAVIDRDATQVENLCKENPELLRETDGFGRTALHIATKEFHSFFNPSFSIMDIILQNTIEKKFNLYPCDKLLNWTWVDYCHRFLFNNSYLFRRLSDSVVEAYWQYQYQIKEKCDWISMDHDRFSEFCRRAFEIPSINMIKNLFSLKYYNNKDLIEVDDLSSRSEITAVALSKSAMLELGTTLMHLGCIYSNLNIVSACIDRGDDVNARDRFGCTPLYYGVCSQRSEIVDLLLMKGADVKLHPTGKRFITLFEMSLQIENEDIMEMLTKAMQKSFKGREFSLLFRNAVRSGNVRLVKMFLKGGIDVNIQDIKDDTPLHIAAQYGHKSVMQLLGQYEPNLNMKNETGKTPLFYALRRQEKQHMKVLLNLGASVNIPDEEGDTLLEVAVKKNYSKDLIQLLLEYGARVNCTNRIGETPLFGAVNARTEMIKDLLNADANVNIQDINGDTALNIAVNRSDHRKEVLMERIHQATNNIEVIKMLLDANANVNIVDKCGNTPLLKMVLVGDETAVRLLVQHQAKVCATNCKQETPLLLAVRKEQIEIINILLNKEVNLNMLEDDATPLKLAETNDNISCKYKMYVNMESRSGDTPLCCAITKQNVEIVNILLENGADVNSVDKNGRHLTPLFVAVETQNVEIVEILLRKRAEVNLQSKYDVTPLYVAVLIGNLNIVKLLLEYNALPDIVTSINTAFTKAKQIGDINGALWFSKCWACRSVNSLNDETFPNDVKHFIQTVEEEDDINLMNEIRLDRKETNVELVDALLKVAADVTSPTPIGIKCLHVVLKLNNKEGDRILLRHFDHKYPKEIEEYTDIGYAAMKGSRVMVKILWRNRQPTDNTFLTRVIRHSRRKYPVEILLENQINVDLTDKDGWTPLTIAVHRRRSDVVQILLDNGADVNGVNNRYPVTTPLHTAIAHCKSQIVRMLLQKGANIKRERISLLYYAVLWDTPTNVICMLLEYGAHPDERGEDGKSTLHRAVEKRKKDIVKKLLKFKADVNITDKNGLTPLDYAIRQREDDIINILRQGEAGADNVSDSNYGDSNSESDSNDEDSISESGSNDKDSNSKSGSNDEDSSRWSWSSDEYAYRESD